MNSRAIVLFTGDPKREALRKGVPAALLGMLHQQLIETVRGTEGIRLVLASEQQGRFTLSSDGVVTASSTLSLGAKIDSAFRFAFGLGCESVILLAGDVAGVDLPLIDEAFTTLRSDAGSCVIGPSGDGGFYLLGLNGSGALASALEWNEIPWFSAATSAELGARASAHGGKLAYLRSVDDIDSLADAIRVTAALPIQFALLRSRLRSLIFSAPPTSQQRIAFVPSRRPAASLDRGPPPA